MLDLIEFNRNRETRQELVPAVIYKVKRGMGILLMIFGVVLMLKGFIPNHHPTDH